MSLNKNFICFSFLVEEAEERNFVVSPDQEVAGRIQEAAGRRGRRRRWNRRLCIYTGRKCHDTSVFVKSRFHKKACVMTPSKSKQRASTARF